MKSDFYGLEDWDKCYVSSNRQESCLNIAGCAWCEPPHSGCFSYSYCDNRIKRKTLAFLPPNACAIYHPSPFGSCEIEASGPALLIAEIAWTIVMASLTVGLLAGLSHFKQSEHAKSSSLAMGLFWITGIICLTISDSIWYWCDMLCGILAFEIAVPLILWMFFRLSSVGLFVWTDCLKPILSGQVGDSQLLQASVAGILWFLCMFLVPVFAVEALTTIGGNAMYTLSAVIAACTLAFLLAQLDRLVHMVLPPGFMTAQQEWRRRLLPREEEYGSQPTSASDYFAASAADSSSSPVTGGGDDFGDSTSVDRRPHRGYFLIFLSFAFVSCLMFYFRIAQHMFWIQLVNVGIFMTLRWETHTVEGQRRNLDEDGKWVQQKVAYNSVLQLICGYGLVIHLVGDMTSGDRDVQELWKLSATLVIGGVVLFAYVVDHSREIWQWLSEDRVNIAQR